MKTTRNKSGTDQGSPNSRPVASAGKTFLLRFIAFRLKKSSIYATLLDQASGQDCLRIIQHKPRGCNAQT